MLNEDLLTKKVLNKLNKHKDELHIYQGEDRWNQYKEIVLEDSCSMKLQYSDDGEINNIVLMSENNKKLQALDITSANSFYNECLNIAMDLFGGVISQPFRYVL